MKWITHKWASLWTCANIVGIIGAIVDLVEMGKDEAKLIAQKSVAKQNNSSGADQNKSSLDEIRQKERELK